MQDRECPHCGKMTFDDAVFCTQCGKNLSPQSPADSKPVETAQKPGGAPSEAGTSRLELNDPDFSFDGQSPADQQSHTRACPTCGGAYSRETVICVACGTNMDTGKAVGTSVNLAQPSAADEEEEPAGWGIKVIMLIAEFMPGLMMPLILLGSISMTIVGAFVFWVCVVIFTLGAVLSAFPIGAIAVICYAQAICWMMMGQFWIIHDVLAEFDSTRWAIFLTLLFTPLGLGFYALRFL